jgi:hypothetical protein
VNEPATAGLLDAILAVQSEAPTLHKTAENPHFRSKFADLAEVVEKVGPLLTKNDLVWTCKPSYDAQTGEPILKYKMAHAPSREFDEDAMKLLMSKADSQGQGSGITYARRYALVAYLNLVADDDDGNAASAGTQQQTQQAAQTGALATAPQKKFLRMLVTKNRLDVMTMAALLKGAGFELPEGEKVNDAIDRLTKGQVSAVIDEIQKGAIKTGESDVPSDAGEFTHPPAEPDETLPFDPSVAS